MPPWRVIACGEDHKDVADLARGWRGGVMWPRRLGEVAGDKDLSPKEVKRDRRGSDAGRKLRRMHLVKEDLLYRSRAALPRVRDDFWWGAKLVGGGDCGGER